MIPWRTIVRGLIPSWAIHLHTSGSVLSFIHSYFRPQEDTGAGWLLGNLTRRHKEMTSVFLHGNMLLPNLVQVKGAGGECSLEHAVQTAVAVVQVVGRCQCFLFVPSSPSQPAEVVL